MDPVFEHKFDFDGIPLTIQVYDFFNDEIIFAVCYKGKPIFRFRTSNQTPVDIDQLQFYAMVENGYEELCKQYEKMFRFMFRKTTDN